MFALSLQGGSHRRDTCSLDKDLSYLPGHHAALTAFLSPSTTLDFLTSSGNGVADLATKIA